MNGSSDGVLDDETLDRLDEIERDWAESRLRLCQEAPIPGVAPMRSDSINSDVLRYLDRIDPPAPLPLSAKDGLGVKRQPQTESRADSPSSAALSTTNNLKRGSRHSPSTSPASSPLQRLVKRRRTALASSSPVRFTVDGVLDDIAEHSGSDTSAGCDSDDNTEREDEGDRAFIDKASSPSKANYDQTAIYHQSLLTQAPRDNLPTFANGPVRRHAHINTRERRAGAHQPGIAVPPWLNSSPPLHVADDDAYEIGSFVVEDKELSPMSSSDDRL